MSGVRRRVAVAMSGGVDSSATAAMLVAEGFDVFGLTLQLYDHGAAEGRPGTCCAGRDQRDARRVAATLGIPHYVLDFQKQFRASVIDDFADGYLAGETPLPCVRCNERVKFRDMLDAALDLGADWLATGHYVRRVEGPDGPELHRAVDLARDQSFFLFATTEEQLQHLRFPLGDLPSKQKTRRIAAEAGLPVASKPDSQDICFVTRGSYADVIAGLRPGTGRTGRIVDQGGHMLGQHDGIEQFTVGQRRGLGIGGSEPRFVLRIDADSGDVIVGPRDALQTRSICVRNVNWIHEKHFGDAPDAGWPVRARVRSRGEPADARVIPGEDGCAEVEFAAATDAPAPGQACVFYEEGGTRLLGGGWIRP